MAVKSATEMEYYNTSWIKNLEFTVFKTKTVMVQSEEYEHVQARTRKKIALNWLKL